MKKKFPYSRQSLDNNDIKAVIKILKADIITRGEAINNFENKICKFVNSKYSVAVNSATSALHIACMALNIKKNDLVWTVPNTFVATPNSAVYCGAKIDFVDIENSTGNIDVKKLEKKLIKSIKKPKLLIPVHFAGQPTDQEKIYYLSKKYNFKILEDASHSLGASRNQNKVGNCKWSDITVFSFHPVKIITSGEGGAATTNNQKLYEKMKLFRNHGVTKNINMMKVKKKDKWYYEQVELGYNYWMSDINASLGLSQLKKTNSFIKKRNNIAKLYNKELKHMPIQLPMVKKENFCSYHLYVIKLNNRSKIIYNKVFKDFLSKKIDVNLHYLPAHLHPFYKKFGFKKGNFPISESHAERAISIPIYYDLNKKDQIQIIKNIKKILLNHVL